MGCSSSVLPAPNEDARVPMASPRASRSTQLHPFGSNEGDLPATSDAVAVDAASAVPAFASPTSSALPGSVPDQGPTNYFGPTDITAMPIVSPGSAQQGTSYAVGTGVAEAMSSASLPRMAHHAEPGSTRTSMSRPYPGTDQQEVTGAVNTSAAASASLGSNSASQPGPAHNHEPLRGVLTTCSNLNAKLQQVLDAVDRLAAAMPNADAVGPSQPVPPALSSSFNNRLQGISEAVARLEAAMPSPAPAGASQPAPLDDYRKLVLIVWDIENVRLPASRDPRLSPEAVLGYLKKVYIEERGCTEYRTVAAVTEHSLKAMRGMYPSFVEDMAPNMTFLLAARNAKHSAVMALKKELYRFITEHSELARCHPGQLTIVLICGDADFLEPVQAALHAGFSVELLVNASPARALLQQPYSRGPIAWQAFLEYCSGVDTVMLPRSQKKGR